MCNELVTIFFFPLVMGIWTGAWAYSFTKLVEADELLEHWGYLVNVIIHGSKSPPDPSKLKGWKWVLYKYTYCPWCLSGLITVIWCLIVSPSMFIVAFPAAFISAKKLSSL